MDGKILSRGYGVINPIPVYPNSRRSPQSSDTATQSSLMNHMAAPFGVLWLLVLTVKGIICSDYRIELCFVAVPLDLGVSRSVLSPV